MPNHTRSTRTRLAQIAVSRIRLTRHPLARQTPAAPSVPLSREARVRLPVLTYARTHAVSVTRRRFGIARSTFYRWRQRFDPRNLAILERRSSRPQRCRQPQWQPAHVAAVQGFRERYPGWGKTKLRVLLQQAGVVLSVTTEGRILPHLKRRGLLVEPRREGLRPYAVRMPKDIHPTQPGDLVQIDTMQLRPLPSVVRSHFTALDVVSRWNVLGVRAWARAGTAETFLARMPVPVRAIQVDGGSEFMADFEAACQARGILLYVLPPRSPKLNGHVKRAQRTHRQEFYECYDGDLDLPVLPQALLAWEDGYNHRRPHQALGYQTSRGLPGDLADHPVPDVWSQYTGLTKSSRSLTCNQYVSSNTAGARTRSVSLQGGFDLLLLPTSEQSSPAAVSGSSAPSMIEKRRAYTVLTMNTLAFTICFAAWVMYGVLVTYLVDSGVYQWDKTQMGWLIGVPVLTGALMRLPMGVLTDKYGGRLIFPMVMALAAVPLFLVSFASSYTEFFLLGLGFGITGASFAVGVAYTSVWFRPEKQGTALGIFGVGTAGSALTSMLAPQLLGLLTAGGAAEGWRMLPQLYAAALLAMAVVFWFTTSPKKAEHAKETTLGARLAPLRHLRVWRFGLYYFFAFGSFVALAQWLVPYYVNVYSMSVASAGLMAALFILPAGVFRALGGWASDRWGARTIMYWTLGASLLALTLLFVPRMEVRTPGEGVIAERPGRVVAVSKETIVVDGQRYRLHQPEDDEDEDVSVVLGIHDEGEGIILFPTASFWQEPVVKVGDEVDKGQLLAKGVTHIYFQASVWIFTPLVLIVGAAMGMASAAVFKHIPSYFPAQVGVVGGIVGVIGGLGGFFEPILFGYLLGATGLWTTAWMFLALVALVCLVWMHLVIQRMIRRRVPNLIRQMDETDA